MNPQLPSKVGPHYRVPWRDTDPTAIYINASLNELYGKQGRSEKEAAARFGRYQSAKYNFEMDAAVAIVNEVLKNSVIDKIVDRMIAVNKPAIVVHPYPEYDAGTGEITAQTPLKNALPFAFAHTLAQELGCEVDQEIVEIARPGRTKLNIYERFLWQPKFSGAVKTSHAYILVDDVCTICGTFAALRSHIVEHGGTVMAISALSYANGVHMQFPIAEATLRMVRNTYGPEIDVFWKEEIGHDISCLTEAEGQRLIGYHIQNCAGRTGAGALQLLRDRIAEAAQNGGRSTGERSR